MEKFTLKWGKCWILRQNYVKCVLDSIFPKMKKNRKPQPQIGYMMHCCFENDLQFKFSLIYLLMPHGIIIIQFWAQPLGITWRRVFFTSWKTVSMVITKLNYDLFSVVVAKVKPPWRLNKNMAPDQSF